MPMLRPVRGMPTFGLQFYFSTQAYLHDAHLDGVDDLFAGHQ